MSSEQYTSSNIKEPGGVRSYLWQKETPATPTNFPVLAVPGYEGHFAIDGASEQEAQEYGDSLRELDLPRVKFHFVFPARWLKYGICNFALKHRVLNLAFDTPVKYD